MNIEELLDEAMTVKPDEWFNLFGSWVESLVEPD